MLDKLTFPVRQPNVSRHNGAPIEDPLKPLNTIVLWCTKGMNEVLNNSPMMPRDAILSDRYTSDRWCFSRPMYTERISLPKTAHYIQIN